MWTSHNVKLSHIEVLVNSMSVVEPSPLDPWPVGHDPAASPVVTRNTVETGVPVERLWAALVDAAAWPRWYPHAHRVRVAGGGPLRPGGSFRWWTLGLPVATTVTEFDPHRRLAWSGTGPLGSGGHHRWRFEPLPGGRTRVVTEEVQHGPLVRVLAPVLQPVLLRFHQTWLERLVAVAGDAR